MDTSLNDSSRPICLLPADAAAWKRTRGTGSAIPHSLYGEACYVSGLVTTLDHHDCPRRCGVIRLSAPFTVVAYSAVSASGYRQTSMIYCYLEDMS